MGPLHKCTYRARNYGVVGAASLFPTQTIVQPDLRAGRYDTGNLLAFLLSFHHVILKLVLIIKISEHAS